MLDELLEDLKFGNFTVNCIGCGMLFSKRGNRHIYCDECAKSKKKEDSKKEYIRRDKEKERERGRIKARKLREKNPLLAKQTWFKQQYNLTVEQYMELKVRQNNKCAICKIELAPVGTKKGSNRAQLDHCHKTGRLREFLCFNCNTTLGKVKDDIDILKNAIKYLEKWK